MIRARTALLLLGALAALTAAALVFPLERWALAIVEWIRGAGAVGVLAFALIFVATALLALPASVLTLGAGFVYGPWAGTLLVSPVSVAAALVAFLLARSALRPRIERRLGTSPRLRAIDEAMARGGARIVLLLRLSPIIPYGLLNYALGLTRVGPGAYAAASFVGMLPATVLYVYAGSVARSAAELAAGGAMPGPWRLTLYAVGFVAAVVVAAILTRLARRALREQAVAGTGAAR